MAWRTTLKVSCHGLEAMYLAWSLSSKTAERLSFSSSEIKTKYMLHHKNHALKDNVLFKYNAFLQILKQNIRNYVSPVCYTLLCVPRI